MLEEELRVGSILFADIVDSSGIIHDHDQESAHTIIGGAIEAAAGSVIRFGGRVNRITGDGIMAMFGAPDGLADHALAACAAALDMLAHVKAIPGSLHLRVGVDSGEFLIHALQAAGLSALDATGRTVHLAARLQQAAGPGEALISAAALAAAGSRLAAEPLPPRLLRGFPEPLEIFRLAGADVSFTRFDEAKAREARFVDRTAERAMLHSLFWHTISGNGQAVLIQGVAGIGKTRLVREIAAESAQGVRIVSTQALRWRRQAALHPFERLVGRMSPSFQAEPGLASLAGTDSDDPAWQALAPSERRERRIAAATRCLLDAATQGPTAVILDDWQWADEASLAALEAALPALPNLPLLLIIMARPEFVPPPALAALATLRLSPLGREDAMTLARERGCQPDQVELVAERGGGNPFFIEEAAAFGTGLPPQARAMLVERVDRLPVGARDVLRMLAVIEHPVAPALLVAAMAPEQDVGTVQSHLAILDGADFLHREGLGSSARIAPRHALLQEVIYRSLTRRRRQAQHAQIARRIGHLPGAGDMLARHSLLGGMWAEAVEHNEAGARRALARFANREAVVLLDRALEALAELPDDAAATDRGIDLRILLREPLFRLGETDRLSARLREAEALAMRTANPRRVANLRVMRAHEAWLTGDLEAAEGVLSLLEAEAHDRGDGALLLRCRFQRGLIDMSRSRHAASAEAMAAVAAAATHPRHAGRYGLDAALAVVALSYEARERADQGDLRAARAAADACLAAADAVGRPFSLVFAILADGHVMHRAGDPAGGADRIRQALPHCEKAESELMRVVALMLLGAAELAAGAAGTARAHLEESVRLAERMRFMALHQLRLDLLEQARSASRAAAS